MAEEKKKQLTEQEEQDVFDTYEDSYDSKTGALAGRAPQRKERPKFATVQGATPEEVIRIRLPNLKNREVIGVVLEDYGQKLLVKCIDGFTRTCRIPGKIRYKVYINPGDAVLVQKWPVQENEKGDYLYKYTRTQLTHLVRKGFLKEEDLQ